MIPAFFSFESAVITVFLLGLIRLCDVINEKILMANYMTNLFEGITFIGNGSF